MDMDVPRDMTGIKLEIDWRILSRERYLRDCLWFFMPLLFMIMM